jgi:hypothetical protein
VRRYVLAALCLTGWAALAGCGSQRPPEVTFTVAGISATAGPAQYCDDRVTACTEDPGATVRLRVPPGTPVQVAVPEGVAAAPWHLVFSYRTPAGERVDARSPLFRPGQQREYTLVLPDAGAALDTAQVQQFGARPIAEPEGGVSFPIRASWVLQAG